MNIKINPVGDEKLMLVIKNHEFEPDAISSAAYKMNMFCFIQTETSLHETKILLERKEESQDLHKYAGMFLAELNEQNRFHRAKKYLRKHRAKALDLNY